jgi:hypothetical protein
MGFYGYRRECSMKTTTAKEVRQETLAQTIKRLQGQIARGEWPRLMPLEMMTVIYELGDRLDAIHKETEGMFKEWEPEVAEGEACDRILAVSDLSRKAV